MEFRLKGMPWEASLLFIGWIWLGWSMFGMTLVNMLVPNLNIYHLIVGAVYLFPMPVIGYKMVRDRNVGGLPLLICSGIVGIWAIALHMKMNIGYNCEIYFGQASEIVMLVLLLVAVPLSLYIYARSIGRKNNRNMKILIIFPSVAALLLVVINIFGINYYGTINAALLFSFLFVFGPVLGGLYIWEIMSKDI